MDLYVCCVRILMKVSRREFSISIYSKAFIVVFKQELILVDKAGWFFEFINTPQKTIYMIETLSDLL